MPLVVGGRMVLLMRMGCMSRKLCREFSAEIRVIGSHEERGCMVIVDPCAGTVCLIFESWSGG